MEKLSTAENIHEMRMKKIYRVRSNLPSLGRHHVSMLPVFYLRILCIGYYVSLAPILRYKRLGDTRINGSAAATSNKNARALADAISNSVGRAGPLDDLPKSMM